MPTIEQARAWYSQADPVHDFDHVLRVYTMAERLAEAEGADLDIVRAAALLHDAEGSAPGGEGSQRASHHQASAVFAAVQHAIRAHRFRYDSEPPQTIEAKVLFDAD